jgi:hypothetical protein
MLSFRPECPHHTYYEEYMGEPERHVCNKRKTWESEAARTATLATLDKIIAYRKAQSKVFGVQTAWEGEGAYILELSKEQERP